MSDLMNPLTRDRMPIKPGDTVWCLDWNRSANGEVLNGVRSLKATLSTEEYCRFWADRQNAVSVCLSMLDDEINYYRTKLDAAMKHRAEVAERLTKES